MRLVFQVCLYVIPILPVCIWLGYNHLPQIMHQHMFSSGPVASLQLNSRLIALAGEVPMTLILIFALINLRKLFGLYEQGIFFQIENVSLFNRLSKLAFWSIFADIFDNTVLEIARTINYPPGHRILAIGISDNHLKLLAVAIIVMLIGMVMEEGRKIQDDMELTI